MSITPTIVNDRELNANDKSLYVSPQAVKGSVNVDPVWDYVRRTGGLANVTVPYSESGEVKDNQQGKRQLKGSNTYAAEISSEVTQQTKDYLIAALHCEQVDNSITAVNISATATGFTIPSHALSIGEYFFVTGLTDTDDNRAFYVSSVSGDDIVTSPAPVSTEAAGASITIASMRATSGKSDYYYSLQNRRLDLSKAGDIDHQTFIDAKINTLSFEVPKDDVCTSTPSFVIEKLLDGSSQITNQTDSARDQSDVVRAGNHIKRFWVDGSDYLCQLQSVSLEIANNLQESRSAACNRVGYGGRSFGATGTVEVATMISDSGEWRRKYYDGTRVTFAIEIEWPEDGRSMIVVIEQAVMTEHEEPSAANEIATGTLSFSCEESIANGKTISVYSNF